MNVATFYGSGVALRARSPFCGFSGKFCRNRV